MLGVDNLARYTQIFKKTFPKVFFQLNFSPRISRIFGWKVHIPQWYPMISTERLRDSQVAGSVTVSVQLTIFWIRISFVHSPYYFVGEKENSSLTWEGILPTPYTDTKSYLITARLSAWLKNEGTVITTSFIGWSGKTQRGKFASNYYLVGNNPIITWMYILA